MEDIQSFSHLLNEFILYNAILEITSTNELENWSLQVIEYRCPKYSLICLSIYVAKISSGVWNYDTANLSKKPSLQRKYIFSKLCWCAMTVSCPEDKYFLSICPGGNFWSKTKWCVWKIPFLSIHKLVLPKHKV